MQPYSLNQIYEPLAKISPDIALYLPRTSNLQQLAKYASGDGKIEVVHYCMKGASKVSVNISVCRRERRLNCYQGYLRIPRKPKQSVNSYRHT
jgi:hypothetical protein